MGPLRFLLDGDMSALSVVIIVVFIALFVGRSMIFRRQGHKAVWRGDKRGRWGRMGWDEETHEEEPQSASDSAPRNAQSFPATGDTAIQAHLKRAQAYQGQINGLLKSTSNQRDRARLQELAGQVREWVGAIEDLARRVESFQQNTLIQQDLHAVPQAISQLETELAGEDNAATRTELEQALASRRNQLASLEQLQDTIKRAEIKIENTASALGTIYSQLLTTQSTDQVADYSRLAAEVDEEIQTLQDYLEALKEVKQGNL